MTAKSITKATGAVLLLLGIFFCWFVVASDYSAAAACGTYTLTYRGMRSSLVLHCDHSFTQDVSNAGKMQHAKGTWRRIGEGGVIFSREFISLPGQQLEEDGSAYADMRREFGVLMHLDLRTYEVVWYGEADPSGSNGVTGRYKETSGKYARSLALNSDHTFAQDEVGWLDKTASATGTWSVGHNGEILFSREFLKPSGQPLATSETAKAMDPQGSWLLQIEIAADPNFGIPSYRKKKLPWR